MPDTPYVVVNIPKASPEEANAGVNDNEFVTPLGLTAFHEGHIASEAQALAGADNDTIMTPLRVRQVMDNEPIFELGTRNEAAVQEIPAATKTLQFTGISTPNTAPVHPYRRTTSAPVCPISFRSLDRYLPNGTISPTNGGYWQVGSCPLVSTIAGSVGDGATNDRVAIQNTIDTYIYAGNWGVSPSSDGAYVGFGRHIIDEPLHVGWGETFWKGVLKGMGSTYVTNLPGTTIIPNFSNAPVINIQGARRSVVSDLSIVGPNYSYLVSNGFGMWAPSGDDRVAANWWNPALAADGDSRYAPMCGVGVDSYSGPTPSPAYPTYTVPSYVTLSSQYNRSLSSVVTLSDLDITGCAVGIVVHACDANGNGDFVRSDRVRIAYCQYGVSIGNTQSRNMTLFGVDVANCYTAFTSSVHGPQSGRIGEIIDCSLGNCINIFELCSLALNGPCNIRGLYTELCWRIGDVNGSSSSTESITFDGCHISLDAQNVVEQIARAGSAKKGVPAACLSTDGGFNTFIFMGGSVIGYHRVLTIVNTPSPGTTVLGTRLEPGSAPVDLYEKVALHSSCGGLVLHNFGGSLNANKTAPQIEPKFTAYNATTGATIGQIYLRKVWLSGSQNVFTPIYALEHAGASDPANQPLTGKTSNRANSCTLVASAPGANTATASLSGLTLTLTFSGRAAWQFMLTGFDVGDILYHEATGSTFFVSARVGDVVTAILQNNFEDPGTGYVPIDAINLTSGLMYCANSRLFTTSSLYYGDFTSGSSVITNVVRWNGTCDIENDIPVGCYLATALEQGLVTSQATPFVSARDTAAKTITLSGNANVTQARVPLWNWFRSI